jgi:hypothetical protein
LRLNLATARSLAGMLTSMTDVRHDVVLNAVLDFLEQNPSAAVNQAPFSCGHYGGMMQIPVLEEASSFREPEIMQPVM